jgi:Mg2+-importing ATPase
LPDAAAAIADLGRDGVTVKILTGANDRVARHVCGRLGIERETIVIGDEIEHLDDAALGYVAEEASVFTRVSPTQILLNNLLYDIAQITIPTDRVDRSYVTRPQRWDMHLIRDFMLLVGPVSSVFDFLTFYVLLRLLHATEPLFHTGWFVESLATQTLVLFVIRTMESPFVSRPSAALTATTLTIVVIGLVLPATPLARLLGFTVLPLSYFVFLVAATLTYLALVELVKRWLVRHRLASTVRSR